MELQLINIIFILALSVYQIECIANCYYFSEEELSWEDALEACQLNHLGLASFDEAEPFEHLNALDDDLREEYWYGLSAGNDSVFRYTATNAKVKHLPPGSVLEIDDPCAYLKPNENDNKYTVYSEDCDLKKKFVCSDTVKSFGEIINLDNGYLSKPVCKK